ncbi:MAG: hypothetical protein GXY44_02060 [Phycisphaerales bacterium]|nr:hypothetical protein [Phycisphaerales bacterium]
MALTAITAFGQNRINPNADCTLRGEVNYNAVGEFGLGVKHHGTVSYLEFTLGNAPASQAKLVLNQRDRINEPWPILVRGAEFSFNENTFTAWTTGLSWPLVGSFVVDRTQYTYPWVVFYEMDLTSWYNANLGKTMSLFLVRAQEVVDIWGPMFEDREGTKTGNPAMYGPRIEWVLADNVPILHRNVPTIDRIVDYTENLSQDSFMVTNTGGGTLAYAISDNAPWLSVNPPSGSLGGAQSNNHTINYSVNNLGIGTHQALITISDNGSSSPAVDSPQTIAVTVQVRTVLPDLDLDGDVDQEDFGKFQACYGTSVQPGCEMADFNGDGAVNHIDFGIFLGCFSGANILADKTCDDAYQ